MARQVADQPPKEGIISERTGPVAVVAGASRGLGLLIARELCRRNYQVVICARDADELAHAVDRFAREGFRVHSEICDVAQPEQVDAVFHEVNEHLGPIEVMICVAGIIQVGPLAALRRHHFTEAVGTMLWGPINTALAVAPGMVDRGHGRIGVITSVGGLVSPPHLLPYSTAKFGAVGFSRGLRAELAGSGVTVTTVAPGLMRTGSHVRAEFVGAQQREYAWFAVAASLPLLSMDADRAARRIVGAILAGQSVLVLTPLAKIAPRIDALFPRTTSALLGLVARLLPAAPSSTPSGTIPGWRAARRLDGRSRRILEAMTRLGGRAADRLNERPVSPSDGEGAR
jgi:NAD(P)-dependent dehydrogenase (short-subunit alcohol dehydrogenase family)